MTVPSGNPGSIRFSFTSGNWSYSKNGGAFTALTNGASVTFANGNTITVKLQGIACSEGDSLTAIDASTGAAVGSFDASNTATCGGGFAPMSASSSTIIYSVWDGDWAILKEYTTGNLLVERYLQGYHGLVKTFVQNVYYYQDELGSTSHIPDGTGSLIESYQYDVYGKPRVYNASGVYQAGARPVAQFLQGGARWMPELGLYDDRNRFMSPDLGRFIQPDPIGFKGDASNLYRYCGNDWANKTDPMGEDFIETEAPVQLSPEGYSYTQPHLNALASYVKVDGGVQAHVKDINLKVQSYIGMKMECVQNGKTVIVERTPQNLERSRQHEQTHRDHWRQWYKDNHDKVVKDLNNGKVYKDEKAAKAAVQDNLNQSAQDFGRKEHDHAPPNWTNYKTVDECGQQRQSPQASQMEPPREEQQSKWWGSHDYIQGIGSTADLKPN